MRRLAAGRGARAPARNPCRATINPARVARSSPRSSGKYFLTCEKYLERAEGFAPLRDPAVVRVVLAAWAELEAVAGWRVTQGVVMPNHVHFMLVPVRESPRPLRLALREFKGRGARAANRVLPREGAFWQADWFDRWVRDASEEARIGDYIRRNPVKAGLVRDWRDWPHTVSTPTPTT